jgi:hypothetical protein
VIENERRIEMRVEQVIGKFSKWPNLSRIVAISRLTPQTFQAISSKADLIVYTNSPQQDFTASKEITAPEITQPAKQQNDFGIGF